MNNIHTLFAYMIIICLYSCNLKSNKTEQTTSLPQVDTTSLKWIFYTTDSILSVNQLAIDSAVRTFNFPSERLTLSQDDTAHTSILQELDLNNKLFFEQQTGISGKNWKKDFDNKVSELEQKWNKSWDNKSCQDTRDEEQYLFTTTCFVQETDLATAYQLYRIKNQHEDAGKYLLPFLVHKDTLIKNGSYPLETVYKRKSPHHLYIELLFPGGVTEIEFQHEPHLNKTMIKTIYSPD